MSWTVKQLSELAGVSVRTLHHYDHIGLLTPSDRSDKNYRLYAERDLFTLQTIQALKFLGFDLKQIRSILAQKEPLDFEKQQHAIQSQIQALQNIDACLDELKDKSQVTYKDIIHLMEVYKMVGDLKDSWLAEILTDKQLKKFAEMPKPTEKESEQYGKDWAQLVSEVQKYVDQDPYGEVGQMYAKKWMDLVNKYWTDQELGEAIWDAYKAGKFTESSQENEGWPVIPQDVVQWIDKAVYFMYSRKKK